MFFLSWILGIGLAAQASSSPPAQIGGVDIVSQATRELELGRAPKASVVVFLSARCPCSGSHEATLAALDREFGGRGFEFIGVHSNQNEPIELARSHFQQAALPFPVIEDPGAKIADQLGAFKTPHVFVYGRDGRILYQGGVDETHDGTAARKPFLKEALAAIDQGKAPPQAETRALGCIIQRH